jgi:hypothetical protein
MRAAIASIARIPAGSRVACWWQISCFLNARYHHITATGTATRVVREHSMADYRRDSEAGTRRPQRDWSDRTGDEVRSWFGDDQARLRRNLDDRDDRDSRWENPRDDRDAGYAASSAFGSYRTDDRPYHDRYRSDRHRDESYRDRDEARYTTSYGRPRYTNGRDAADEYFRAAREQRDELLRYEAQSPGAEFEDCDARLDDRDPRYHGAPSWARERGGYWRQYEGRSPYVGRGPKDYRRSDERVREEVCDCMTDDPMLDASEITVQVSDGVVTLNGTVTSREQKRRAEDVAERISGVKDVANQLRVAREANGHTQTAAPSVTQSSETGTPSKSSSTTT